MHARALFATAAALLISTTAMAPGALADGDGPDLLQGSGQWQSFTPKVNNITFLSVAVGSDKQIWFNEASPYVGHYNMTDKFKQYELNVSGSNGFGTQYFPQTMALGGTNLYINGQDPGWGGTSTFAVLTPKHALSVYAIPSGDSAQTGGIAYDPINKNVWISEASHIGKIDTTTNTITEYLTNSTIIAVAYGPDGNIWAYGGGPSEITVLNPVDGSVVATYPFTCGFLYSLTTGSDGNLYGAGAGCGNFMAKIIGSGASKGQVSRVTMASAPSAWPTNIASVGVGFEKGHIFVAERAGHNLFDYNPATGLGAEIAAPSQFSGDTDQGLVAGPDGNIWSADFNGNIVVYDINLITANPSSLKVGVGANSALSASEPDGAKLTATSSNTSVATVVKASGGGFTVTGVASGSCTITLKDSTNNSVKVPVTVQ